MRKGVRRTEWEKAPSQRQRRLLLAFVAAEAGEGEAEEAKAAGDGQLLREKIEPEREKGVAARHR